MACLKKRKRKMKQMKARFLAEVRAKWRKTWRGDVDARCPAWGIIQPGTALRSEGIF